MKTYWGVEVQIHALLTSAVDGGEWSGSCTSWFTQEVRALDNRWTGGWMGPRTGLDSVAKRNKSHHCPCR